MRRASARLVWKKASGSEVILTQLSIAKGPWARMLGLMGQSLSKQEGLLIPFCSSVHTYFCEPLDLLFVKSQDESWHRYWSVGNQWTVVDFYGYVPWGRMVHCAKAHAVIEMKAGFLDSVPLAKGDALCIESFV